MPLPVKEMSTGPSPVEAANAGGRYGYLTSLIRRENRVQFPSPLPSSYRLVVRIPLSQSEDSSSNLDEKTKCLW